MEPPYVSPRGLTGNDDRPMAETHERNPPSGQAASRSRFHSLGLEQGLRHRPAEHRDHLPRLVGIFGVWTDAGGIDRIVLDIRRQRPDQSDALVRHDLADLVDAELRLAGQDVVGDRAAVLELLPRLPLAGAPEFPQELLDIAPARAAARGIDERHRISIEPRLL